MGFFFFNYTATTEIYTLSLHDALPISTVHTCTCSPRACAAATNRSSTSARPPSCSGTCAHPAGSRTSPAARGERSEEHTSELQSRQYLVCRLLLEKKDIRGADHQEALR